MKIWQDFIQEQIKKIGEEAAKKWLLPLKVVHFDAGNLYLEAQDMFQLHWFEEYMRPQVLKNLRTSNQKVIKVHLSLASAVEISPKNKKKEWRPLLNLQGDRLDPNATFDSFISGEKNQINLEILKKIGSSPEYNPIFLCGAPSCGKTHLLMAVAYMLKEKNISCLYLRAESFTEQFIAALQNSSMAQFRDIYRKHDVLLMEDIDIIGGKLATQEELFHTFNTFYTAGKQMVFTAKKLPRLLTEIEPRLTSRFEWGIVLDLEKLTPQEFPTLLKQHIQRLSFPLIEECFHFLLSTFSSSPKTLIQALETLCFNAHLQHIPSLAISQEKAKEILENLLKEEKKNALSVEKIIQAVGAVFEVTAEEILGKSHSPTCVLPRQAAIYLCRLRLKIPFKNIGKIFGRDHSTIMTSVKSIEQKIEEKDQEISTKIAEISKKLNF